MSPRCIAPAHQAALAHQTAGPTSRLEGTPAFLVAARAQRRLARLGKRGAAPQLG